MGTRTDRGFRFPLEKFDDRIALHTNFKYLQEYLNYIRRNDRFTAHVIIAPKGSEGEDHAHFVTDGSDDEDTIADAFATLGSSGGAIVFLDGNYAIDADVTFSKPVDLIGRGAKLTFASSANFNFSSTSGHYSFQGFEVTRSGSSNNPIIAGSQDTFTHIMDNYFHDINCGGIIRGAGGPPGARFLAVSNFFEDINLERVGGGFSSMGLFGGADNPGNGLYGSVVGNVFTNITDTDTAGFSAYIAAESNDSGGIIITGNVMRNISDLAGITPNAVGTFDSHNIVDEVMVGGSHTGTDHGGLSGLSDDDHTQYLNVSRHDADDHSGLLPIDHGTDVDGLADDDHTQYLNETRHDADDHDALTVTESQITDLDHDDTDAIHDNVAGEISALTLKSPLAAADHVLIEDSAAANAKKRTTVADVQSAESDHGLLSGLADDDHTQYLNDTRHNTAHGAGRWKLGTNQSIPNNTSTVLDIDTLVREDDADGDITMNLSTGIATINNAGWYYVAGGVFWTSNSTGFREIVISSDAGNVANQLQVASATTPLGASSLIYLAATERVWLTVKQTSGAPLDANANDTTHLSIMKVRE